MGKETVQVMIEGGKATAAPPLGPALGPLKVNIGQVVGEINNKTQDFKGMQVPVTVTVDTNSKEFTITIGTPPTSALLKKEAGVQKGASNPKTEQVANLTMDKIYKISQMKRDSMLGKNAVSRVREVLGTCSSLGMYVEGKHAKAILDEMKEGKYLDKIPAD